MKNIAKHGFTLVELLVVVLIIGILSSVALPQYQKAVNKSRVAGYWPGLKNLAEASRLCSLEKGTHCNLDELDIEAPTCKKLPEYSSCQYTTNGYMGDGGYIKFSGNGDLYLGVTEMGRFCGGSREACAKYGALTQNSGTTWYPYDTGVSL